jgi:hypothetical protein
MRVVCKFLQARRSGINGQNGPTIIWDEYCLLYSALKPSHLKTPVGALILAVLRLGVDDYSPKVKDREETQNVAGWPRISTITLTYKDKFASDDNWNTRVVDCTCPPFWQKLSNLNQVVVNHTLGGRSAYQVAPFTRTCLFCLDQDPFRFYLVAEGQKRIH